MKKTLLPQPLINERKIIFIGGAKGVGKHAVAKNIQNSIPHTIIIDKDETSSVLNKTGMDIYEKNKHSESLIEYMLKIEPLEYEHFIKTIKHLMEYNNCNIIAIAQFFNQFAEDEWIESIKSFCELNKYSCNFVYIFNDKNRNRLYCSIKYCNMTTNKAEIYYLNLCFMILGYTCIKYINFKVSKGH
jgi:hypothetical protein